MPPQILRKDIIKSVHDDIHGGVAATRKEDWDYRLGAQGIVKMLRNT